MWPPRHVWRDEFLIVRCKVPPAVSDDGKMPPAWRDAAQYVAEWCMCKWPLVTELVTSGPLEMGLDRIHPTAVCCSTGVPIGPRLILSCRISAKISAPKRNLTGAWNASYESAIFAPKRWVQSALNVWTDGWYDVTDGSISESTILLNLESTQDETFIVVRPLAKDACTPRTPCIVTFTGDVGSLSFLIEDCEVKELSDSRSISARTSWPSPWRSWTWASAVARNTIVDAFCYTKARSKVQGVNASSETVVVWELDAP